MSNKAAFYFDDLVNFKPLEYISKIQESRGLNNAQALLLAQKLSEDHDRVVKDEFALRDDTYYDMNYRDFLDVAERIGFVINRMQLVTNENAEQELLYELTYNNTYLVFSTYNQDIVDSAFLYYSLKLDEPIDYTIGLQGELAIDNDSGYIWNGSNPVIEGLRHFLNKAENGGIFIKTKKPIKYAFFNERFNIDVSTKEVSK